MRTHSQAHRAFTLFELVVVMLILVIVASLLAPSLRGFGIGRSNANAADLIVALARDARTQSIGEARTYRLNFDPSAGQVWLSYLPQAAGFSSTITSGNSSAGGLPSSSLATGAANSGAAATVVSPTGELGQKFTLDSHVQMQCDVPTSSGGQYIEFRPTGRADLARVTLTDTLGGVIHVGCLSATEEYHVLSNEEAGR